MTTSISKLPAPSTLPPTLDSGTVKLFKDNSWSSPSLTLSTSDYASNQRHSIKGDTLQNKTTWLAFNLPEGTVVTLTNLLELSPPGGNVADLKGCGHVVDLIGTGSTEGVDLVKLNMGDQVTMFFWRRVDLSQGAIELYQGPDYAGNRTVIFPAEWSSETIHSLENWFIANSATSARWSALQETQAAVLYAQPDGGGKRYSNIKGWGSFKEIRNFADVGFNDNVASFSWSTLTPNQEVVHPLEINIADYAGPGGLTSHLTGHNNASTVSTQTISITEADAETLTVSCTNVYTGGVHFDFTYSKSETVDPKAAAVAPQAGVQSITKGWKATLGFSFTYQHTDQRTTTVTKTQSVSMSQQFNVPPYSDYDATLTVYMGKIPDSQYTTTAERWYTDELPGSVFDTANGWYKRTEEVVLQVKGMVACTSQLDIIATPIPGLVATT